MSLLIHFLIATTLIAGFILLRVFVDRYTLRKKIQTEHTLKECDSCELKTTQPNRASLRKF